VVNPVLEALFDMVGCKTGLRASNHAILALSPSMRNRQKLARLINKIDTIPTAKPDANTLNTLQTSNIQSKPTAYCYLRYKIVILQPIVSSFEIG
jgi:hypothetical protein